MKVLAINSLKGGVGKTATAVNIAFLASCDNYRVLLWDFDVQSSASFYFRVENKIKGKTEDILKEKSFIKNNIKGSNYKNLDIIPSDFSLKDIDIVINDTKKAKKKFVNRLDELEEDYDIVIFDCPPGFNQLLEYIINISHLILFPLIPTTLSVRAYDLLVEHIKNNFKKNVFICPFFTMVDRRKKMHKNTMDEFSKNNKYCLKTTIPYSSTIELMGEYRAPVAIFAKHSKADNSYRDLWGEIKELLGGFNF
ncbi:MAG: ParA family protein [Deferribacterota bacterium]|nr:ParA family protein [Deferribacterota bacterium]